MTETRTIDVEPRNRSFEIVLLLLLVAEAIIRGLLERGNLAYGVGSHLGITIGALLLSLIVYGIVRAIRARDRGPAALQFVLLFAVVLGAVGGCGQDRQGSAAANKTGGAAPDRTKPAADVVSSWGIAPLVPGPWEDATSDARSARVLLDEIVSQCPDEYRDQARAISRLRTLPLPFFSDDVELVEGLVSYNSQPAVFTVLAHRGHIYFMNGSLTPFKELIARTPIRLEKEDDATAYLRVASSAVSAQNGTFKVVNSVDDLDWLPSATDADKQVAAKAVRPTVWSKTDDGLKASATTQYGSGIHTVVYLVHTSGDDRGKIEMTDDFPLADGLPVSETTFKGPLRYQIGKLE